LATFDISQNSFRSVILARTTPAMAATGVLGSKPFLTKGPFAANRPRTPGLSTRSTEKPRLEIPR
jgi:hypothetical protein